MAAQSFKEWFDIVTDVGNLDPFYGFTAKGIAHIGWDAAIKSLEGVQTQTTNSRVMPCAHWIPGGICNVFTDNRCGKDHSCIISAQA